jgi:hypothetical protein
VGPAWLVNSPPPSDGDFRNFRNRWLRNTSYRSRESDADGCEGATAWYVRAILVSEVDMDELKNEFLDFFENS